MTLTSFRSLALLVSPSLLRSTCAVLQTVQVCVSVLFWAFFLQYIIGWNRSVNQISKHVLSQSKPRFCLLQSVGRRAWIRFNWLWYTFVPPVSCHFHFCQFRDTSQTVSLRACRLIKLLAHMQFPVPLPHNIWYSMLPLQQQSPLSRSLLNAVIWKPQKCVTLFNEPSTPISIVLPMYCLTAPHTFCFFCFHWPTVLFPALMRKCLILPLHSNYGYKTIT